MSYASVDDYLLAAVPAHDYRMVFLPDHNQQHPIHSIRNVSQWHNGRGILGGKRFDLLHSRPVRPAQDRHSAENHDSQLCHEPLFNHALNSHIRSNLLPSDIHDIELRMLHDAYIQGHEQGLLISASPRKPITFSGGLEA